MMNIKENYNVGDLRGFQELRGWFSNYAHCTEKYRLVNLILNRTREGH
jgi:hypothetical protein